MLIDPPASDLATQYSLSLAAASVVVRQVVVADCYSFHYTYPSTLQPLRSLVSNPTPRPLVCGQCDGPTRSDSAVLRINGSHLLCFGPRYEVRDRS